tara:strand:+ start:3183 stop:4139 length:957 start_codon:yes stop_codon:yes gene_type:complete
MSKKFLTKKIFKFNKLLLLLFFLTCGFNIYAKALENKIEIKINNKIITSIDILNEIKILKLINKNLKNFSKEEIREIAKKSLIKNTIQEIELLNYHENFNFPEKYYMPYLNTYIKKLGFNSYLDFQTYNKANELDANLIKKKIIVELLWSQLIYEKYFKNVKIDEQLIRKEILKNEFQNEYLLSELVFNIEKKKDYLEKLNLIKKDIETKGFENAAITHSVSETSSNGGNLGWIKETSLSPKVKNILNKTELKKTTEPLQIPGGFLILKIVEIRKIKNDINLEKEIKQSIRQKTNKQLSQYSNIYLNKIKKDIKINAL